MVSRRFDDEGNLIIPEVPKDKDEKEGMAEFEIPEIIKETRTLYIIRRAFCPNGHNLMDGKNTISGYPTIRLRYHKKDRSKAEVALSAALGDSSKIVLEGELGLGELVDIHCPFCDIKLPVLTRHKERDPARGGIEETLDLVVLYLTPELDYSKAVTFCNKVGKIHATIQYADTVIQDLYKQMPDFG